MSLNLISIDFETYPICEEYPYPKPVCLSYFKSKVDKGVIVGIENIRQYLHGILNSDTVIIAHNLSFELNVIRIWFPELIPLIMKKLRNKQFVCTQVLEQMIDCSRKRNLKTFSLASLVKHYLDKDISDSKKEDSWRLRYNELEDVPLAEWPQEAYDYALNDSIYCYIIYLHQSKNNLDCSVSVAAHFYLNAMGEKGFEVDKDLVQKLEIEALEKLTPAYETLYKHGILKITKGKSSEVKDEELKLEILNNIVKYKDIYKLGKYDKKLREYIEEKCIKVYRTVKGVITFDKEALPKYKDDNPNDEVIKALIDVQELSTLLRSHIVPLKRVKTVIRSTYQSFQSTGRTSSSGSKNYAAVNIQQVPKE